MSSSNAPSLAPVAGALLVSEDPIAITVFQNSMRQLAVTVEVCIDTDKIRTRLATAKIEAVIVDMRLGLVPQMVMEQVRSSPANKQIVFLAIADSDQTRRTAGELGASFVFEPPFSAESIDPALRASYGMIVREKRRYFRAPICCRVFLTRSQDEEHSCVSVNVSEGGMSITTENALSLGSEVQVRFTLPELTSELRCSAKVLWSDDSGRVGLQFISLSSQSDALSVLQGWLARRLEASFPVSVTSKFSKRE